MAKQVLLTSEGLKKLQDELENLKTVRRKENECAFPAGSTGQADYHNAPDTPLFPAFSML